MFQVTQDTKPLIDCRRTAVLFAFLQFWWWIDVPVFQFFSLGVAGAASP